MLRLNIHKLIENELNEKEIKPRKIGKRFNNLITQIKFLKIFI